jgi:integrase
MKLAVAARLLSFGVTKGHLDHNRALGIQRMYSANRAHQVWTPDQIDVFCGGAPVELAVAARLAYVTAQRQGDLLRLTWSDVSDDGVRFRTSKTGVRIFVPMYDELRDCLAEIPRRAVSVLTTASARPWQVDTFRHEFRNACRAVGVGEGLHFHDLRGSALKAFADAGCSEPELRSISGHSMKSTGALANYIDSFSSLAVNAVRKRENALRTKIANQNCKPAASETSK